MTAPGGGWLCAVPPTGACHDATAHCLRCPCRSRASSRSSASTGCTSTCTCRSCSTSTGSWASSVRHRGCAVRLVRVDGARSARPSSPPSHRFAADQTCRVVDFVKGQRKDDVMHEYLAGFSRRPHRGRAVHRPGAGEDPAVPHREAAQRRTGATYPWIVTATGVVNHFYFYCRRRRLRSVLPQVLLLLPLQRQAVHQRQRVRQAAGDQGRDRVHRVGQRFRRLRGPGGHAAGDLRPADPRQDRRTAAQVAGPAAAPIHPGRPGRRLPLRRLDPAGRVLPDPDARPAGLRADLLRAGHPRQPRPRPTRPGQVGLQPPHRRTGASRPRAGSGPG